MSHLIHRKYKNQIKIDLDFSKIKLPSLKAFRDQFKPSARKEGYLNRRLDMDNDLKSYANKIGRMVVAAQIEDLRAQRNPVEWKKKLQSLVDDIQDDAKKDLGLSTSAARPTREVDEPIFVNTIKKMNLPVPQSGDKKRLEKLKLKTTIYRKGIEWQDNFINSPNPAHYLHANSVQTDMVPTLEFKKELLSGLWFYLTFVLILMEESEASKDYVQNHVIYKVLTTDWLEVIQLADVGTNWAYKCYLLLKNYPGPESEFARAEFLIPLDSDITGAGEYLQVGTTDGNAWGGGTVLDEIFRISEYIGISLDLQRRQRDRMLTLGHKPQHYIKVMITGKHEGVADKNLGSIYGN